ncbi:MAG: Clp protease ClpP [Candidatus Hydrogenedentes bacterium]|nr:Clp protease ClpP [Candidatus Hydrogenedentota bacterium]
MSGRIFAKASGNTLRMDFVGSIGDGELTARGVSDQLRAAESRGVKSIHVVVNSPGGYAMDGVSIYQLLKTFKGTCTTEISAYSLSAASMIVCAGERISAHENSLFMIHMPHGLSAGGADDLRKDAHAMDVIARQFAGIYAERTGKSVEAMLALMRAETWFSGAEIINAKFADELLPADKMAASFDLGKFHYARAVAKHGMSATTRWSAALREAAALGIGNRKPATAKHEQVKWIDTKYPGLRAEYAAEFNAVHCARR